MLELILLYTVFKNLVKSSIRLHLNQEEYKS